MSRSKYIVFLVILKLSFCIYADENAGLNQEDLENLKKLTQLVSVASVEEETINHTPAIVSRYDAEMLRSMGLKSLRDMLSFIPGFVVQDHFFPGKSIMIRGVSEALNQKVLFLVDETPYWMPAHGDFPISGLPIEAIDHIEVIRGPGAVYYGTNATSGVIKVVTKNKSQNVVSTTYGTGQRRRVNFFYNNDEFIKNHSFTFAFEKEKNNGLDYEIKGANQFPATYPIGTPTSGILKRPSEHHSLLAKYNVNDFVIKVQHSKTKNRGLTGAASIINESDIIYRGDLLSLGRKWVVGNHAINSFVDYNRFYMETDTKKLLSGRKDGMFKFSNGGKKNYRLRAGINSETTFDKNLMLFYGFETEKLSTGSYGIYANDNLLSELMPNDNTREDSFYSQLDYKYKEWRFLLGGRFTNRETGGDGFTPRASLVYSLDESKSIKLLYSIGFKSSNFTQRNVNIPGSVQGNPNLDAELNRTTELAYSYSTIDSLFVLNGYYLEARDFIQREVQASGVGTFSNIGEFERYGFEIDFQKMYRNYEFYINSSYVHQGNEMYVDDPLALFVPKNTVTIGSRYTITSHHTVGVASQYMSRRGIAPSFNKINLSYNYINKDFNFLLNFNNVTSESVSYPDLINYNKDFILKNDKRVLLAELKLFF